MSEPKPRIEILYCPKCGWLLRAAWMAQELLTTFADDVGEVALVPSEKGTYIVRVAGHDVFDRRSGAAFPEPKALKRLVRDVIAPERDLGHADRT